MVGIDSNDMYIYMMNLITSPDVDGSKATNRNSLKVPLFLMRM